jgi:hypothetical protein
MRTTAVVLAIAATLTVVGAVTLVAGAAAPAPIGVEDEGANCPVTLPGSLASNSLLPDPFKSLNGNRITSKSQWICRREEIKQLAEKYVYGTKPGKPASVSGTVSRTSITVNVSDQGHSASFSATVTLPSGTGPFPAVVVLGGLGADTATIQGAGAAIINYDPYQVGKEGTPRNNKQGAFYTLYGATSTTGLLQAWGWGVSRIIDVIAQSGGSILRADGIGVTGCSRFGKGAFVTGVFDERIALTMPIESGSAGVPIFRGIPGEGAQSLSSAYSEQPWLGDAFSQFTSNPNTLPVDTHEMVAMVAPRGLFIMDNPFITNLGPKSASVAALGGAEVYKALGVGDNISYWSDIQNGNHCALRPEWTTPLQQNIRKFLLRTTNDPGVIRISSSAMGNLSSWRDWTTPTLSDSTSAPPTSTPPTSAPPTTMPPTTRPPTTPPTTAPPTTQPPTTPPTTQPPGSCRITFMQNPPWNTGYTANMTIANTSSTPINGWTLRFTLGSGQSFSSGWNANYPPAGTTGTITATNVGFNAAIPAGGSITSVGFQVAHTGNTAIPTGFTLNGAACSVA